MAEYKSVSISKEIWLRSFVMAKLSDSSIAEVISVCINNMWEQIAKSTNFDVSDSDIYNAFIDKTMQKVNVSLQETEKRIQALIEKNNTPASSSEKALTSDITEDQ